MRAQESVASGEARLAAFASECEMKRRQCEEASREHEAERQRLEAELSRLQQELQQARRQTRTLARAHGPMRVRCGELSAQKQLLSSLLAAEEARGEALGRSSDEARRGCTALNAQLTQLVDALSGRHNATRPAPATDGAPASAVATPRAGRPQPTARWRWRFGVVVVLAILRLVRLARRPGTYLGQATAVPAVD